MAKGSATHARCQLSTTAAACEHINGGGKLGKELPEAAATRAGCSCRPERRAAAAEPPADFEAAPSDQTSRRLPGRCFCTPWGS